MNTEKESKDCSVDKLQVDQNGIDEDMMQNMYEKEGDDRVTRHGPRSMKVLVTSHTNDTILDDDRVQTMPK